MSGNSVRCDGTGSTVGRTRRSSSSAVRVPCRSVRLPDTSYPLVELKVVVVVLRLVVVVWSVLLLLVLVLVVDVLSHVMFSPESSSQPDSPQHFVYCSLRSRWIPLGGMSPSGEHVFWSNSQMESRQLR